MKFIRRTFSFNEFKPHGFSAERKVRAAFVFALVCLGAIGTVSFLTVGRLDQLEEWSRYTAETISMLRLVQSHLTDGETAQRGYEIVGDESYLRPYNDAKGNIGADLESLRKFIAYNPQQERRLEVLKSLVELRMNRLAEEIEIRRSLGFPAAQAATASGEGKRYHDQIRAFIGEMITDEKGRLLQREAHARRSSDLAKAVIFGGSTLALGVVAGALIAAEKDFARRRANGARLALAGRLSRMGAWAVEMPEMRQTWSDEVFNILEVPMGVPPTIEESIGTYSPEFRGIIRSAFEACISNGIPFDLEVQVVTGSHRRIWVRNTGEADFNKKGGIRGIHGAIQDISERKQDLESVRRQQAELRVLFDLMPAMVWFKDTHDLILRVNKRAADAAGKSVEEIEGRSSDESYPQRAAKFRADDLEVIRSGLPKLGIIEQLPDHDGKMLWVRTDKVPVFDLENVVVGVIIMAHDITESRLKDENIRRLASIVENSADAIIGMTFDGIITSWNPAAEAMFGYAAGEIIGRPLLLLLPHELCYEEDEVLSRYARGELVQQFETVRVRKDGKTFDVAATISPIRNAEGGIVGVSNIFRDITDRKHDIDALRESETRFRQLAENIDEVFWIADPDVSKKLYISPAYEKIWGQSCQSAYESPDLWVESIRPEDYDRVIRALRKRNLQGVYDEEYCILRPDGKERRIRDRAFPVRDAAGEIKRWVGVAEDITEYRSMEDQLRHTQKMEAIGTLAGGIAHDFNNILTSINGYTELSRMILTENEQVREYLGAVLQASSRAADLVRQILTFSRQERVERRLIQLRPVIAETIKLLRASIPSTIEFEISLATDAPAVLADATQIHQVLMNLGTNAWHAMKDRPGRLQVRLERCSIDGAPTAEQSRLRPGVYARVSVSDTGCGMDEATRLRIFEPFFTTKPPGEGTGLGLAVVLGIMETHDGAVTVESELSKGTTFHLYFPEHAGEATSVLSDSDSVPFGCGQRILFVDDEDLLAHLGYKTLTALGYDVTIATEPLVALAMVRADPQRFALVLTDQTMSGMTGVHLATQIRQIRPSLPVILMTGHSMAIGSDQIDSAGILKVLLKPTSIHSIGDAVHAALSSRPTH